MRDIRRMTDPSTPHRSTGCAARFADSKVIATIYRSSCPFDESYLGGPGRQVAEADIDDGRVRATRPPATRDRNRMRRRAKIWR